MKRPKMNGVTIKDIGAIMGHCPATMTRIFNGTIKRPLDVDAFAAAFMQVSNAFLAPMGLQITIPTPINDQANDTNNI